MNDDDFEALPLEERRRIVDLLKTNPLAETTDEPERELTDLQKQVIADLERSRAWLTTRQ